MAHKIRLDDIEYEVDHLSERGHATLASLEFATRRMQELSNMHALLLRAKNSYLDGIKKEILTDKAGFLFGDD